MALKKRKQNFSNRGGLIGAGLGALVSTASGNPAAALPMMGAGFLSGSIMDVMMRKRR